MDATLCLLAAVSVEMVTVSEDMDAVSEDMVTISMDMATKTPDTKGPSSPSPAGAGRGTGSERGMTIAALEAGGEDAAHLGQGSRPGGLDQPGKGGRRAGEALE